MGPAAQSNPVRSSIAGVVALRQKAVTQICLRQAVGLYTANKQPPFKSPFCHTFQNCIYSDLTTWAQISIDPPQLQKTHKLIKSQSKQHRLQLLPYPNRWPQGPVKLRPKVNCQTDGHLCGDPRPRVCGNWELAQTHGNPPVM